MNLFMAMDVPLDDLKYQGFFFCHEKNIYVVDKELTAHNQTIYSILKAIVTEKWKCIHESACNLRMTWVYVSDSAIMFFTLA